MVQSIARDSILSHQASILCSGVFSEVFDFLPWCAPGTSSSERLHGEAHWVGIRQSI